MSSANLQASSLPEPSTARAGDAFVAGLVAMLVINVGQRLVGLARNLGFCHFLSEADLGLWALANSFFIIAAPLAVLGLPGSFGKFVEHYRLQGCLRAYLQRLLTFSLLGLVLCCLVMLLVPESASRVLYGASLGFPVIVWTAVALICLVGFNTTVELVVALRLVRLGSLMHFVQTLVFTVVGLAGVAASGSWLALLPAYALASLAAVIPGVIGAWRAAGHDLRSADMLPHGSVWTRILPFAAALWCSNLIGNLFDLSDRYMLLHLTAAGQASGQALVGQFYCGRILPNLLLSLGMMLGGVLLPYLSADWERRDFGKISARMNNLLVLLSLGFTALSLAALALAPLLFDGFLGGRYQQAAEILPLGLILASWAGLSTAATAYLLCAEKGKQNASLMGICLVLNLLLNWPLILWYGLYGAALATTVANGLLLLLVLWRVDREGCPIGLKSLLFCGLPLVLICGEVVTATVFMALTLLCGRTNWILDAQDRQRLDELMLPYCRRWRLPLRSLWPRTSLE